MEHIVTVGGAIPPAALGFCQSHEHLYLAKGHSARVHPALCIDDPALCLAELTDYRAAGGGAVVDAQPVGCGRDPEVLARLSADSGVHIIASTGFHKLLFYPDGHWLHHWEEERLTDLFQSELTLGMFALCDDAPPQRQTAIRAGQIKTALDTEGLTPRYQRLFRAAARAALGAGAPLMAHIEQGADALALADFLQAQGLPPARMIFCHLDRAEPDLAVHRALCDRGIFLEYDTVGRPKYHSDDREVEIITALLAAGFEDRLLLSLDVTRARLLHYGGAPGLCYILGDFLPLLRRGGVDEAQIEKIFHKNPIKVFTQAHTV